MLDTKPQWTIYMCCNKGWLHVPQWWLRLGEGCSKCVRRHTHAHSTDTHARTHTVCSSSHHRLSMPLARSCALLRKLCLSASVAAWFGMAARAATIQGYASPLYTYTTKGHGHFIHLSPEQSSALTAAISQGEGR